MGYDILEVIAGADEASSKNSNRQAAQLDGVVIGLLTGFSESGKPVVVFPGNQSDEGIPANSTTQFKRGDIGCQVALLFEGGAPQRPIVIGRIQYPDEIVQPKTQQNTTAELDGERLELKAEKEIVLRCGKASITLTKAGKIILRGAYVLSRSSGVNKIKGGSVHIN